MDDIPEDISPITKMSLDEIQKARNGALWFEANFDERTTEKARYHVHFLFTGEISAEQYFSILKQSISTADIR